MKNSHRRPALAILLLGISLFHAISFCATAADAAKTQPPQKTLCADPSGVFLGLATDEEAYSTTKGAFGDDENSSENGPQDWILTADPSPDAHSGNPPTGPQHSYDGRFLQVLPDTGRSYPPRGRHLQRAQDLDQQGIQSPYVAFWLKVAKEGEGIHTMFLRWTGGDTVGGGDSLYVVLYRQDTKKKNRSYSLVHGQQTVKPSVVPIDAGMSRFAGCCYDHVTHACPCFAERPDNATCPTDQFITRDRASQFGIQCLVGGGAMTIVHAPEWYLYAGQEAGDVMDFDSEPWDVTCEADGSNTRDSGHDFPSWWLREGHYELRIYAREDGTALDGIYVAGPTARAPTVSMRYSRGDSTFCVAPPVRVGRVVGFCVAGILVVALLWFATATQPGKEILGTVLSKPAQAVRYVYVDST